ncbi:putative thiamine transporter SLC35F3 [Amphibalanus amphitrite]|uniref:putative thiamine transporter SLC35F3 n=1 Tax=Amphibalanus amphitrite TaxID=1232801 RepID=UPI001C92B3FE|nr:putative thiamine transporter SLC35F3 [Amphibalanus amphitrite]XP_043245066.1 putative thiamine transporter SLC35F3 [Amphibalanus amphitrite]
MTSSADESASAERHERRSISSLFSSRRVSSGKLAPTLIVNDELQLEQTAADGRSLHSFGCLASRNGSVLGSPTLHPRHDSHRGRLTSRGNSKDQQKLSCWQRFKKAIFSKATRKLLCGIVVAALVTISWVGTNHFIKMTYYGGQMPQLPNTTNSILEVLHQGAPYDAPFFTTWFCTTWTTLVFPIFSLLQCINCRAKEEPAASEVVDAIRYFRDRGYTLGQFMLRTFLFCLLWVVTNYLHAQALRELTCTDAIALFSTSLGFVYLLSWVVLHEQFVGVRIVAVIMCNTGVALLAYMDGIAKTPTLGSVVMGATGAAGSAAYKVFFRKVMADCGPGPVSVFLSLIALISTLLLWPVALALSLSGTEVVTWTQLPWLELCGAAGLGLAGNLLISFGGLVTYDFFVSLGLILAVPLSAAIDMQWYNVDFEDMRLAGNVLIVCGFFLVLFPSNWPNYIRSVIRWGRRHHSGSSRDQPEPVDYRTGIISRSHLRSPSGHVR